MKESTYFLRFRVGIQWYAVSVRDIVEVLQMVAIDPLPDTPPDVLGVITLRNEIMSVVDLRVRFGTGTTIHINTPLIALKTDIAPLAIVVDEVDNVIEMTEELHKAENHANYVRGITRWDDKTLLILDVIHIAQSLPTLS